MQEKRHHGRARFDFAVEFSTSDGERRTGVCRNMSLGGLHIDTVVPPPFGAPVTVFITFARASVPTPLPGIVRWIKPGQMGVQFGLLGARETHALADMLAGLTE